MRQCPHKRSLVILAKPASHERFFRKSFILEVAAQQIATQYRSKSKRHHGRSEQRYYESYTQRDKHTSFHSCKEEKRHEADYNNKRGVKDRHTHLARSVKYHIDYRTTFCLRQRMVDTQVFPYILYIDYGIVNQRTDGNSHTTQAHSVDAKSHVMQYQYCYYQRQWQSNKRDDCSTCISQKEEQHYYYEYSSFVKRTLYVADRAFNKARLTECIGRNFHIGRKVFLQIFQSLFKLLSKFYGSGIRLLGYCDKHCRLSFLGSQAQLRLLRSYFHVGYIFKHNRSTTGTELDYRASHLIYIGSRQYATHYVFIAVLVYHTSVGILIHTTGKVHYFAQRNAIIFHALRVKQYLIFLYIASKHGNLSYTARRKKSRTNSPICQSTEVEH